MHKKIYLIAVLGSFFNLTPTHVWAGDSDEPSPHCSEITERDDCNWPMGSTTDDENYKCQTTLRPRPPGEDTDDAEDAEEYWSGGAHCIWDTDQGLCRARCVSDVFGDDELGPWVP